MLTYRNNIKNLRHFDRNDAKYAKDSPKLHECLKIKKYLVHLCGVSSVDDFCCVKEKEEKKEDSRRNSICNKTTQQERPVDNQTSSCLIHMWCTTAHGCIQENATLSTSRN
jgi:hypothetical protein